MPNIGFAWRKGMRADLMIAMRPENKQPDADGWLRTTGSSTNIYLELKISNRGDKAAGPTTITAWVGRVGTMSMLRWVDSAGTELPSEPGASPDETKQLIGYGGQTLPSYRLTRTLDDVPLVSNTLYLRVPAELPHLGSVVVPIEVHLQAADGESVGTHAIHLKHVARSR